VLSSLVAVYRGVFLYGASGNGKSSLVNAGLIPAVRELGFVPVRIRVQPRAGEEIVVERIVTSDGRDPTLPPVFTQGENGSPRIVISIADFEQRVHRVAEEHRPLLIFDQFEEILTLFEDEGAIAMREQLAEMVVRLLRKPLPVKLVLAFREDYLGRVKQLLGACPELVDQALRLGPPSADALDTIIRGPFERFPGHFARQLPPSLAQRLSAALAERFGAGDVSLSEVQTVCLRLWRSSDAAGMFTEKGIQGLLEDELGEALSSLPHHLRAPAVAVLSHMVTSAGTRNVVSAEDLSQRICEEDAEMKPAFVGEALELLERESKLVRSERRRELYLYEITSEFLVPWISRRREELKLLQEHRRGRRRLRILGSVATVLVLVVAAVAIVAVYALRQREKAESAAANANSLALAAAADEAPPDRPDMALALAFRAFSARERPEATTALIKARLDARRSGLHGVLSSEVGLRSVSFSADGRTIYGAGQAGIVAWDPQTGEKVGRTFHLAPTAGEAVFSPDGKTLAYASDGGMYVHRIGANNPTAGSLPGAGYTTNSMAFSPDGAWLGAAGDDGVVHLWNLKTGEQIRPIVPKQCTDAGPDVPKSTRCATRAIAFSGDGRLATLGQDRSVGIWKISAQGGHPAEDRLKGVGSGLSTLAFGAAERRGELAVAGGDGRVRLIIGRAGQRTITLLPGGGAPVRVLAFSPDARILAAGGRDGTIRLLDLEQRRLRGRLTENRDEVVAMAFSPDGRTLAAGYPGRTVSLWNPLTDNATSQVGDLGASVVDVAYSTDGAVLATLTSGKDENRPHAKVPGTVVIRGAATPASTGLSGVNSIAFRPLRPRSPRGADRHTVAIATEAGVIRWSPRRPARRIGRKERSDAIAFSPDGAALAAGRQDGSVDLWRPITRAATSLRVGGGAKREGGDVVTAVAFSPTEERLAAAHQSGTVELWDVAGIPARTFTIPGSGGQVNAISFSSDGKILAIGGANKDAGVVRLWDLEANEEIKTLSGHKGPVNAVAFGPRGTLASGDSEGPIILWDVATWKRIGSLPDSDGAKEIILNPDRITLTATMISGKVRIWRDPVWKSPAALEQEVCDIIGARPNERCR
jgi:WD40 repeat protein